MFSPGKQSPTTHASRRPTLNCFLAGSSTSHLKDILANHFPDNSSVKPPQTTKLRRTPHTFTPAQVYPIATSRSTTVLKSKRSRLTEPPPPPYSKHADMNSDTDDDRDEDGMIYTSRHHTVGASRQHSSTSLRSRIFGLASANGGAPRSRDKPICTTPGEHCAGETETETDEPSRHLPTARIIPSSGPLVPPNGLQQRLTPLLFEFSRSLSIVPALVGTIYNLYHVFYPPPQNPVPNTRPPPERLDFFISALWAILTGYQCLHLTTGLLTRWRLYYPPLSTLVRLLALQGICWPATQLTLTILEHEKRPALVWALIATTTCMSRSVQIWVTSNLWWDTNNSLMKRASTTNLNYPDKPVVTGNSTSTSTSNPPHHRNLNLNLSSLTLSSAAVAVSTEEQENRRGYYWKKFGGGKWGGRRWDWKEVGIKCMLPAGVLYFVMAWVEQVRRELAIRDGRC